MFSLYVIYKLLELFVYKSCTNVCYKSWTWTWNVYVHILDDQTFVLVVDDVVYV